MKRYRIEICRVGVVVKVFETDDFETAKSFYNSYTDRIGCSTELYIDGERIRYGRAWDMMSEGTFYLDYRSEKTKRLSAREEKRIWD